MWPNLLRNLSPRRIDQILAGALFLSAFGLRLIGIGWGLPNELHVQSYHPDEFENYLVSQRIEPSKLDFTPGFYNYGTLYFTVLRVASSVSSTYGGSSDDIWKEAARCHLAGRVVNSLAGAATVLFVFLILRRITNPLGASMGALLIGFAPAHVVHSRFQTPDIFMAFLLVVSLYFSLRSVTPLAEGEAGPTENSLRLDAAWAGVFAGLSAGTKYTGIVALLALYVVVLAAHKQHALRLCLIATGAALLAFVVSTPGVLLDAEAFRRDFSYELGHSATGHGLVFIGAGSGYAYHIQNLIFGVGFLLTILGVVGLLMAATKKQVWAYGVLAVSLVYFMLIARAEIFFIRYTFPLYAGLACGFGWLMGWAHERKGNSVLIVVLGIIGLGGVDFGGLRGSITMTAWMASEDSRDEVARILKDVAKTEPDAAVGLPSDPWFYTPPLYPFTAAPRRIPAEQRDELMAAANRPKVVYLPFGPEDRSPWNLELLTKVKPDYVVYSSFEYGDVARLMNKRRVPPEAEPHVQRAKAFLELLQKDYESFRYVGKDGILVHDLEYIRPNIQIWKRKSPASTNPSNGS